MILNNIKYHLSSPLATEKSSKTQWCCWTQMFFQSTWQTFTGWKPFICRLLSALFSKQQCCMTVLTEESPQVSHCIRGPGLPSPPPTTSLIISLSLLLLCPLFPLPTTPLLPLLYLSITLGINFRVSQIIGISLSLSHSTTTLVLPPPIISDFFSGSWQVTIFFLIIYLEIEIEHSVMALVNVNMWTFILKDVLSKINKKTPRLHVMVTECPEHQVRLYRCLLVFEDGSGGTHQLSDASMMSYRPPGSLELGDICYGLSCQTLETLVWRIKYINHNW